MRRKAKEVNIGGTIIGGDFPIAVQSMLSIPSYDKEKNVLQALKLKEAGCEILRVSVPDKDSLNLIYELKQKVNIPLVADIHFDHKLAIESIYAGADKIRINPGNIGTKDKIKELSKVLVQQNIPVRIGVNSGSLEKEILKKYSKVTAEAMAESSLYNINLMENYGVNNIVVSLKSSDVLTSVKAYELVAEKCCYPLHLGITETGTSLSGTIKSSIGIGSLLLEGIGDTIRVSLTDDPLKEIEVGIGILKSLKLRNSGVEIISCPTCGRTRIDIINLANKAENLLKNYKSNLKVAIMGCVVNGPGEAKEADIGITGANGMGIIFKKGKVIKKVKEKHLLEELLKEVDLITSSKSTTQKED